MRLAMYVGIFQFYCTWKIENSKIFWSDERFVYTKSVLFSLRWAALAWFVEKNSMWHRAHVISEIFQICFEKVHTHKFLALPEWNNRFDIVGLYLWSFHLISTIVFQCLSVKEVTNPPVLFSVLLQKIK